MHDIERCLIRNGLGLFASLLGAACTESVASTDVRTSGIYPEISVIADGSGSSRVEVMLKVGGNGSNTFLELRGGDRLEATARGETKALREGRTSRYVASFDVDEEGTEFEVAFLRGAEDDDAPSSVVVLPEQFDVSVGVTEASRTFDSVPFSWEPEVDDGEMYWYLEGPCILDEDGTTADDGANTLSPDRVESLMSQVNDTCEVELALTRSADGELDEAFSEGGEIVASQRRIANFRSTP